MADQEIQLKDEGGRAPENDVERKVVEVAQKAVDKHLQKKRVNSPITESIKKEREARKPEKATEYAFDQGEGRSNGYSVLNCVEQFARSVESDVPESEALETGLNAVFEKYDPTRKDSMLLVELLDLMKAEHVGTYRVQDWRYLYSFYRRENLFAGLNEKAYAAIRKSLMSRVETVIFTLRLVGDEPHVELDENNVFVAKDQGLELKDFMSFAAVAEWHGEKGKFLGWKLQGTNGKDFGEGGCFYLKAEDLETQVQDVIRVRFRR